MAGDCPEQDRRWQERLAAGDDTALAEVYDAYSPIVFGLATRIVGERCAAEDVTQEVFLHLWERPESYDCHKGPLRPWLSTLARRRAIDWTRRRATQRGRATALGNERPASYDIEHDIVADAVAKTVRDAVRRLPPAQHMVITLTFYQGLTTRRVAEVLGIPPGTAKSRLRLALRHIADHLTETGIIDP